MTQLNLFKHFKASSPSQQVDFTMPWWPAVTQSAITAISGENKEIREVMTSPNRSAAIATLTAKVLHAFFVLASEYFISYWKPPSLYSYMVFRMKLNLHYSLRKTWADINRGVPCDKEALNTRWKGLKDYSFILQLSWPITISPVSLFTPLMLFTGLHLTVGHQEMIK